METQNISDHYFAGFFDGEGCISISIRSARKSYFLSISAAQNERAVLDLFQARFGGVIYKSKWKKAARAFYQWYLLKKDDKQAFLEALTPLLVVKKNEAIIGLEFIKLHKLGGRWATKEDRDNANALRVGLMVKCKAEKTNRTILAIVAKEKSLESIAS